MSRRYKRQNPGRRRKERGVGAHKTPPTATLKAFEPDMAHFLFSADLSSSHVGEKGHGGVSVVLLVLTARDAEPRLSAADTNSCTEYTKICNFPMFVSAGLSLLYDLWPKPVRPVLFCLHLWDLHDLQQRGWHRFNSGLPAPGSLRRRCHDDTGGRTSPGWVERKKHSLQRWCEKKKVEEKKQRNVQKLKGFALVYSDSGSLIQADHPPSCCVSQYGV